VLHAKDLKLVIVFPAPKMKFSMELPALTLALMVLWSKVQLPKELMAKAIP
jgi:hypothetical protein